MPNNAPVIVSVETTAAPSNTLMCAAFGRWVGGAPNRQLAPVALATASTEAKDEARAADLMDADIDAELADYNMERRMAIGS